MTTPTTEFWNNPETTRYFADKPADPRIVDFLDQQVVEPGQRALDLGCGGGRHSEMLASLGYEVSSIDVNPAMLDTTRSRLAANGLEADVRTGSITDIPYADASFDMVVTTGVLHQARSTKEYGEAMSELSRVSNVGSYVLLNVFTNPNDDNSYEFVSEDRRTVRTKEGLLMTLLPSPVFVDMMADAGFSFLESQGEETKMENTGPRTTFRAFFQKTAANMIQGD